MIEIVKKIQKDVGNSCDIITKKLSIEKSEIYLVFSEVLASGEYINEYVIKCLIRLKTEKIKFSLTNIKNFLYGNNIVEVYSYQEMLDYIYKGFCLLINKDIIIAIEAKNAIDRSIPTSDVEVSLLGPKDAFNEKFNDNLALIRKRLRTNGLYVDNDQRPKLAFAIWMT